MRKIKIELSDEVYGRLLAKAGKGNFAKYISRLILEKNEEPQAAGSDEVIASILVRLDTIEAQLQGKYSPQDFSLGTMLESRKHISDDGVKEHAPEKSEEQQLAAYEEERKKKREAEEVLRQEMRQYLATNNIVLEDVIQDDFIDEADRIMEDSKYLEEQYGIPAKYKLVLWGELYGLADKKMHTKPITNL